MQTWLFEGQSIPLMSCAGLYSDKISKMCGIKRQCRIISYREEYSMANQNTKHLVKNLTHPVFGTVY